MSNTGPRQSAFIFAGASALALALALSSSAHAAGTAVPAPESAIVPADETAEDGGRDIVVTAQRREERLQDVPVAITALDNSMFAKGSVGRSANEILNYIPNASAGTQQHGRPRWWIRGVGAGQQQLDLSSPVGFYLDDVYISNANATGIPLFDLERVEVLRGPQGTLWGKNTTGGAINVISKRPSLNGQNDSYVKLEYGSYDDKVAEGGVGTTIVDGKLAARASFRIDDRGGRYNNLFLGTKDNAIYDSVFRGQILAKPTDTLEALLSVHYRRYKTQGNLYTTASYAPSGLYRAGYTPSRNVDDISTNAPDWSQNRQIGGSLHIDWDVAGLTLTSITGYERFDTKVLTDNDYTPLEISRSYTKAYSSQWTQELRLTSPKNERFNWIAGLFYFNEKIFSNAYSATLPQGATPSQAFVGAAAPAPAYSLTSYGHKAESGAVFGSATYGFTDAIKLTLGGRFTRETKTLNLNRYASLSPSWSNYAQWWNSYTGTFGATGSAGNFGGNLRQTWDAFTYDITPSWKIDRNNLLYFKFAHGVKSGGFNTAATLQVALAEVAPEKLDSFEGGYKSQWLDGKLTFNATVFHYDYKNVQVNIVGPNPGAVGGTTVSYLQNAGKAHANGAEIEVNALPLDGLRLDGSVGILHTRFDDLLVRNSTTNLRGAQFVRSPHLTLNGSISYEFALRDLGKLELAADARYTSRQFYFVTPQDVVNRSYLQQGPYTLTNLRVTYTAPGDKLSVTGYVNNLTDVRYLNHSLPANNAAQGITGDITIWDNPRTFGVSALYRF